MSNCSYCSHEAEQLDCFSSTFRLRLKRTVQPSYSCYSGFLQLPFRTLDIKNKATFYIFDVCVFRLIEVFAYGGYNPFYLIVDGLVHFGHPLVQTSCPLFDHAPPVFILITHVFLRDHVKSIVHDSLSLYCRISDVFRDRTKNFSHSFQNFTE